MVRKLSLGGAGSSVAIDSVSSRMSGAGGSSRRRGAAALRLDSIASMSACRIAGSGAGGGGGGRRRGRWRRRLRRARPPVVAAPDRQPWAAASGVVVGDDPSNGGENLLHRRFLCLCRLVHLAASPLRSPRPEAHLTIRRESASKRSAVFGRMDTGSGKCTHPMVESDFGRTHRFRLPIARASMSRSKQYGMWKVERKFVEL